MSDSGTILLPFTEGNMYMHTLSRGIVEVLKGYSHAHLDAIFYPGIFNSLDNGMALILILLCANDCPPFPIAHIS
jgi:hypothetical protein